MKITYLSHSCFLFETATHKVVIDPFITGNALAQVKPEDIECDFVLVTHGHQDHVGDSVAIAKKNDATIIAPYEVAAWLGSQGVKAHPMGLGGGFDFPFGRVKLTVALHSAGYPDKENEGRFIYLGTPAGMLITMEGKTVYHAGDTALTLDMQLIGQRNKIDVAILPIGDNFTMGPDDAVVAAEFLKPGLTLPMHYNTFPQIKQDPQAFVMKLEAAGIRGAAPSVGETITI